MKLILASVFLALSWVTPAFSQSEGDKATADALFDTGRKLMAENKFSEACPKFRDSNNFDPAVGTLLNLALCYNSAGQTASAWSTYRAAAAMAKVQGSSERELRARDEAKKLEEQLVRFVVEISPEANEVEGLLVTRDEQPQVRSTWGVAVPVDPGEITIKWSAPGYEEGVASMRADSPGQTLTFTVPALKKLQEAEPAPPPQKVAAPAAPPKEEHPVADIQEPGARRSAGPWILGGIGVAAGAAGTAFGVLTLTTNGSAKKKCPDQDGSGAATAACTSDDVDTHESLVDRATLYRTAAYIGWGVGGAAVLGAGIWAIVASPSREAGVAFAPLFTDSSLGLSAKGSF